MIFFLGFGPVDDQKMEFTVDMFLRQRWNDPRLAFGEKLLNTASNIDTLRKVLDFTVFPWGYFFGRDSAEFCFRER